MTAHDSHDASALVNQSRLDGWTPPKPLSETSLEELRAIDRRANMVGPVLNINSLDPYDARGIENPIDRDVEDARFNQDYTEVNSTLGDAQ